MRNFKHQPSIVAKALQSAIRVGFDPYNSHETQSVRLRKIWRDRTRRSTEFEANRLLIPQAG